MTALRFAVLAALVLATACSSGSSSENEGEAGSGGDGGASGAGAASGGEGGTTAGAAGTGGSTAGASGSAGGEAGSSSGGGGGRATGGSAGTSEDCRPVLNQADLDTGFEECADGSKRRRTAIRCPTERTSPTSPCRPGFGPPDCAADAECTREPNGYCANAHNLTGYCGCFYGCLEDADCEPGSICECGVVVGRCVPASCTTNADCDPGFGCVATVAGDAGTTCTFVNPAIATSYSCQTSTDECSSDADCPDQGNDPGACFLVGDHRACGTACALTP